MTIEAVRDLAMHLTVSTGALVALGAALNELVTGVQLAPAIKAEIDHLLDVLGARSMLDGVSQAALQPVLAEIRATLLQGAKLLGSPPSGPGWTHTEAEVLQSQGEVSAAFPGVWKQTIVPRLEGLSERLESTDGAFLDVGVGIGALAIAMARQWPSLRVVGIDPWRPALAIARENVRRAELLTRIELREQAVQDLSDTDAFDLAWLPMAFIDGTLIRAAVERAHHALRLGGWLLFQSVNPSTDPLTTAFVRLRTMLWGGCPMVPGEAEGLLNQVGYTQVQTLQSAPTVMTVMIVGRRS
jgi:Methyltransferase domain